MNAIIPVLWCMVVAASLPQNVDIPDPNFLTALIEAGVDLDEDGEISQSEAEAVTNLVIIGMEISDLTGIEAFTNLEYLDCGFNQLTSLNVSQNTALARLDCYDNQLTSLNVSGCPDLYLLGCFGNQLTSLDLSNNPALEILGCWLNLLTGLDLSNNPALTQLYCSHNMLTSLDLSINILLELLFCYDTQLTRLDISNNPALVSIDLSNNPTLFEICVWEMPFPPTGVEVTLIDSPNAYYTIDCTPIPCTTEDEYLPGEGFRVETNLSCFPGGRALDGYMQRGDVIAVSAEVTDKDHIRHRCICGDDTTSTLWGPYQDNVNYDWTLAGEGKLLVPDDMCGTVLYELPVCITTDYTATVRLKVSNGSMSMAADKEISGSVTIHVTACPTRIYPSGMTPDWSSSCLKVEISKNPLGNGEDGDLDTQDDAECYPEQIGFSTATEIQVPEGITVTEGEFCKPDYAVLLSADAVDYDLYVLKCEGESGCESEDSVAKIFYDPLKYEWSLESGSGEFPMGKLGKSVVFHKSRSEGATIKCIISNADLKSSDPTKELTTSLGAAEKPKAFVGLGDDEATFTVGKMILEWWHEKPVYVGRNSAFLSAARSMETSLESAGYEVEFYEHVSRIDINHAAQDPIFQAFAIVGHGSGGAMNMAGTDERVGTIRYFSNNLVAANQEVYQCNESPRIRDLQLIGCEALRGNWSDGLHCGARLHGWRTTKLTGSLRYYAYWTFTPLPPVNLSLE